jgi:hypothetical protein
MNWTRRAALIVVACVGVFATGCIPVNIPPGSASFTSPYHGSSWQGQVIGMEVFSTGTGFYGCTDHNNAIVKVLLSPPFGGTDTSGGPFTIEIKTPYEDDTQILDFAQPMSAVTPLHQGDCFHVYLSSFEYYPPGQPARWDGADYTISW